MIGPESRLWTTLAANATAAQAAHGLDVRSFTRIETATQVGVSDVEYAIDRFCGWIELKTSSVRKETSKLTLHSPFTTSQWRWLSRHHRPSANQRSWLLVGRLGPRTWTEFLLLTPRPAFVLTQMRVAPLLQEVRELPGVYTFAHALDLLHFIGKET